MKLSAAIEQAITSGAYNIHNEFMCCVLNSKYQRLNVSALQDMVAVVAERKGMRGQPLVCALHANPNCAFDMDTMSRAAMFKYTKQLYCWYVFDLKRKGL